MHKADFGREKKIKLAQSREPSDNTATLWPSMGHYIDNFQITLYQFIFPPTAYLYKEGRQNRHTITK